jgi:DNA-binding NtrC family response regulator
LFLDEIGELDRKLQVKLLRVLDGTPYYRLGGVKKVSVDVRIVAATNQDLEQAVREGRFRGDLYHRLRQIHIRVPPLRERPDDIVPLARFFLRQQRAASGFSEQALGALRAHGWPGNVRELRNAVIQAAVLAPGEIIERVDLPCDLRNLAAALGSAETCNLEGMERRMIRQALAQTEGHHRKAAELLGISRRTLSRKLKHYGVEEVLERCFP